MKKSFLSLTLLLSLCALTPNVIFANSGEDEKSTEQTGGQGSGGGGSNREETPAVINLDLLNPRSGNSAANELAQLFVLKGVKHHVKINNNAVNTVLDLYADATEANAAQLMYAALVRKNAQNGWTYKATHAALNGLMKVKQVKDMVDKTPYEKLNVIHPDATKVVNGIAAYYLCNLTQKLFDMVPSGSSEGSTE